MERSVFIKEVDNYHCGDCKYFKVNAEQENIVSTCKRIDHKKIKFTIPFFKSYNCGQFASMICSDFQPHDWNLNACKEWTSFEDYWDAYVEQWLPYKNTNKTTAFTLKGDTSVRYHVPLLDYIYGRMIKDNKLMAVEKSYYKQDRSPTGFGYKLIVEPIKGVDIT